tara:strand:- start:17 stop:667 length:651 start_codon:yes stop_codon:yes gene_type:complete
MGKPLNNLQGFRFGSLTVLQLGEKQRPMNGAWWLCLCDCGTQKNIPATDMVQGKINSCGCEHAERIGRASITHGKSKSRTYKLWMAMRNRCDRINQDYSCRGIVYDERWKSFENFLEDMGEAPEGLSLDRIDCNGNYHKANCRWATRVEQANNTRANVFIEWDGKRQTRSQWEKELCMRPTTLRSRIKAGWPMERAMKPLAWVAEGNTVLPADENA